MPIPMIGDWYRNESGDLFEVVALDDDDGVVEIQYFDGTVEELDGEAWDAVNPVAAEPPEDWSGSLDIEREDYGVDLEQQYASDWPNSIDEL